jgi:hypothetical protein
VLINERTEISVALEIARGAGFRSIRSVPEKIGATAAPVPCSTVALSSTSQG